MNDDYFQSNKELWNKRTMVHKSSDFYDLEGFKQGKNVLKDVELEGVGDVSGKSMLHLQCHFGLDSMSWSRMGAAVTAIDFSDKAIFTANEIKDELGLDTRFICSNVYDLKDHITEQYDIVFTSYGVVGWLPDMNRWAEIINHFLKPGGMFYMVEFHPYLWMFDDDFTKLTYSYFNRGVLTIESEGTYTDHEADIKHTEYSWNHSISEVVSALIDQGLKIESMQEQDYSPYNCFTNMVSNNERGFYLKGYEKMLPMVYSVKAVKN